MKEERPVKLHLYKQTQVTDFGAVCRKHNVKYEVRETAEDAYPFKGYYVNTEPVKDTMRRNIIADWSKASMEIL